MVSANGKHPPCWLDRYVEIADAQSPMTPLAFHQAIGLWLISTAIGRRLVVRMPHDDVYPSLWVMLLASSTLYAKTTALTLGRQMLRCVASELLLPDTTTPEALIESLSKSAQRGMVIDEASGLMAASERDYMAGTLELYMRMYDCPPEYTRMTKGNGLTRIEAGYVPLLAASTPALMKRHLKNDRLWASGWWARFGILVPPADRAPFRESQYVDRDQKSELISTLARMRSRLDRVPPAALDVIVERDAMDAWKAFDKEARYDRQFDLPDNLRAAYGRAPAHALKIATCLAATDWPNSEHAPRIHLHNIERGIEIARAWLDGAEQALITCETEGDKETEKVRRALIQAGGNWLPLREIVRIAHVTAKEAENVLTGLEAIEEIEVRETKLNNGQTRIEARWLAGLGVEQPL